MSSAGYGLPDQVFGRFIDGQQAWLEELLASLSAETVTKARDRARSAGVRSIKLESRAGEAAPTIVEIAQEKAAGEFIVGKRGAGRLTGLLLGSVSQKLVGLSPLPVTVIA